MIIHANAGFALKSTRLDAIKAGNVAFWTVLKYQNVANYSPLSDEALNVPMTQTQHNVCSTNPNIPTSAKLQARTASPPTHPAEITNKVHI